MCLYPQLIKNPKYKSNGKNGGNIPPIQDPRVIYVPIGCGNCIECRKQKAREWQVRLLEEIKVNKNARFITLTFSNESIKELMEQKPTKYWPSLKGITGYHLDNEIAIRAVRLFLERYRKHNAVSLRHWLVTELGHNGTENIHLHGLIWTDKPLEEIEKYWKYGFMWKGKKDIRHKELINYVNEKTIGYIIKYISKTDEIHTLYKSKILTSKGIGKYYTQGEDSKNNKYKDTKTNETYRTSTGHKIGLPIYYRNKIYTEEEREKLWLHKLDKNERWIRGTRIDISKGQEEYEKWLQWHRKLNTELGYGNNKRDEEKENYEIARREIMQWTRIQKAKKNNNKDKSRGILPPPPS